MNLAIQPYKASPHSYNSLNVVRAMKHSRSLQVLKKMQNELPKVTDIVTHDEDDSLQTIDASNNEMEKAYSKYFTSGNAVSHSSFKGRHDSLQSQSVAKEIDANKRLILRYKAGRKLREAIQNES